MNWRRKKIKEATEPQRLFMENGSILLQELVKCCNGKTNPITTYSTDQILKATNNFNKSNLVGKDDCDYHYYRGTLDDDDNRLVMIKKKAYGGRHVRKICRDISVSSMVSGHKNFLKLLGCCLELTCPALVCEYAESITVNAHHQIDPTLTWNKRIQIARDISNSLAYLHTAFSTTFIHRNVHPRNVFLDVKGVAKLGDFRNCVTIPQGESFVRENKLEGTYGYLDPKYMSKGMITENVDVYGFGVFMLVLLSRRTPGLDDELHPDFLTRLVEDGRFVEILDPVMLEGDFGEGELCRMEAFFLLSLKCIGLRGEVPEMMEVSKELKRIERF
ncbi:hypothetical protein IGI04_017510 [Brassica rapa subsp. trilocularis]|uniref:Protein kinase domain-containing protein n=1 Tax=Brassica rapa subsp. trilocularis TaxID=1813537 RepID=A0ABQ7MCN4_BRACM|nr:hypothetical protein IGI04_017510 [Brassica rapa subsp. trilocularis]